MSEILSIGQTVRTESSKIACTVEKFLAGGGQGEVYQASLGNQKIALKWYFPHYLQYEIQQRERLEKAIGLARNSSGRWNWHQQPTYQALATLCNCENHVTPAL